VFVGSIVGTFALGLGGITAVFSVVHAVLLNPLPYPEPEELVRISTSSEGHQWPLSAADYLAIEEQQTQFESVGAMSWTRATYSRDSGSDRMLVHSVTPGVFPLLGIQPVHGRVFVEEERNPGAPSAAVLGWEFWSREFGGDPSRLGETVRIDGREIPVVGVLPAQVGPSLQDADIILPLRVAPPLRKGPFFLVGLGRLGEGVSSEAASAELVAINERIFPIWKDSWQDQEATWAMTDLKTQVVGDVGTTLMVILGAAVFVLIMVCANAASLLLARILDRRRELAVRAALGASPTNLVAHLAAENGLLVILGSLGGMGLAVLGIRLTTTLGAPFIPRISEVGLTGPVLLFSLLMSAGSLVLFGILPALKAPRARVSDGLREGGARIGASAWTRRVRSLLVTTQFAVSLPVLVGGGLLAASFLALTQVDAGFDANRVLALDVALPADAQRSNRELAQVWDQLLQEVRSLPGVGEAGVGQGRPPADYPFTNNFVLEDQPVAEGETQPSVPWIFASEEYFEALGSRLVAGRMFGPVADGSPPVALVDEAFARRFYSGPDDALGRSFVSGGCTGEGCPRTTIIGVMEEVRYTGLEGTNPGVMFLDSESFPSPNSSLVIRAQDGVDPSTLVPLVRDAIWRSDSRAAVSRVATGQELLSRNLRVPRYLAALMGSFGGLSLLLAVIGIYGVMEYFVRQHRRDMGIRIALGGEPAHVLRLVLSRGMALVAVGLGVGLAAALFLSRFMASLLHGIGPTDSRVVLGAMTGMAFVAALACWGPARRAATVPPREVLAEE
jgi:putative ABC transport system permease protein